MRYLCQCVEENLRTNKYFFCLSWDPIMAEYFISKWRIRSLINGNFGKGPSNITECDKKIETIIPQFPQLQRVRKMINVCKQILYIQIISLKTPSKHHLRQAGAIQLDDSLLLKHACVPFCLMGMEKLSSFLCHEESILFPQPEAQ